MFLLFLLLTSNIVLSQPQLKITEPKKSFGSVKRGTIVDSEYEIVNSGTAPLIITGAEVSCSCTTVDYPTQPILPGQKHKIIVHFNTTTVWGRQDRYVNVVSNDPKSPTSVRYKGTVSKN